MEKAFSEKESLAVINEMIGRARNNVQRGAGNSMIYWGCSIAAIAVLNYVLMQLLPNPYMANWVWGLTLICWLVEKIAFKKAVIVKTHIDNIIQTIWLMFFAAVGLFLAVLFSIAFLKETGTSNPFYLLSALSMLITPVILILWGLGMFITAQACKFQPFRWGGVALWAGALLCIPFANSSIQFLILAACSVLSLTGSGILLNKKAKK